MRISRPIWGLALVFLTLSSLSPLRAAESKREEGALVFDGIPEVNPALKERLEQYENVRTATFQSWLGDEILITTRFGESAQIHKVSSPMSAREQITFGNEPISSVSVRPKTKDIYFLKDAGGNEFSQIYRLDLTSGKSQLLTDGKSKYTDVTWQKSGKGFAFTSTKRNGKDSDIYFSPAGKTTQDAELLVAEGGSWSAVDWSEAGDQLIVMKDVSATENFLYLFDVKSKKLSPLLPGGGFAFRSALFAKDGKSLYLVCDKVGEFQTLYSVDLATQKMQPIAPHIKWDVETLELSDDGKVLAFVSNENGTDVLNFYATDKKSFQKIDKLPLGVIGRLEFADGRSNEIAFSLSHAKAPSDVFTYTLADKKLTVWTKSEAGGLNREIFVTPKTIAFPTFDKVDGKAREIPAFYYPAVKKDPAIKKSPVVVLIHGGPEAQFQSGFNATVQAFATELGVSVIAPNVRGSSGYGKTYLGLDNGYLREDSVKDIGALLDWIKKQDELDGDRIMVMGGSYGGYMVLASLVHYSDKLAGGIDTVGISHFVTFLKNTQAYRVDLRRVEYGDERDEKMKAHLEKISPLTNVSKIRKPLLVVQGLNDPRVPASEAEQIVKAVRSQGLESWYLLAKDEGHGFQKKKNQAAYLQTVMMFADKILKPTSKVGGKDRS